MASSSFRDSINSLGWARRDTDLPVHTSRQTGLFSSLQSLNPFGDRGYVQLPTTEGPGAPLPAPSRREEEEGWFACRSTQVFLFRIGGQQIGATRWLCISNTLYNPRYPCVEAYVHPPLCAHVLARGAQPMFASSYFFCSVITSHAE